MDVWVGMVICLIIFSLLAPLYIIAFYKHDSKPAFGFSFTTRVINGRVWEYLNTPGWYTWFLIITLTLVFVPLLVVSFRGGAEHSGLNMVIAAGLIYICYRLVKIASVRRG